MAKYIVSEIDWETDGEFVKLPKKIKVELPEEENPSLEIASILSDRYGYLVNSFEFERTGK